MHDDLAQEFWGLSADRASKGTELWLAHEEGQDGALVELRRLLHTVKGEAHMLGLEAAGDMLELAEDVVDRLPPDGTIPAAIGDTLLNAFEFLVVMGSEQEQGREADATDILAALRSLLDSVPESQARSAPTAEAPTSAAPLEEPAAAAQAQPEIDEASALRVEKVRPLVHELRRLLGERVEVERSLREAQRMLRAVLAEIDPSLSAELLKERIVKTLGYGWEVERRMTEVRAQWSAGEFSFGMGVDGLEDALRRASMVAVSTILPRAHRLARSTAATLNKEVELSVVGDAYVDDTVIRRLDAALVHLVRNAVDHGIEAPEARTAAGKPRRGTLRILIEQHASRVTVSVDDDGAGIDVEALRARAGDAGRELDEGELLKLIFEQGISTRAGVTEISGRGVGLDVVAQGMAAIGGEARVESEDGLGTRFSLEMPATTQLDVVVPARVGNLRCAFPSAVVRLVTRLRDIEQTAAGPMAEVDLDGRTALLPLYSLAAVLGEPGEAREGQTLLVLSARGDQIALATDECDSPRPVALQQQAQLAFSSPVVSSASPTADGGVLLVLDAASTIAMARGSASRPSLNGEARTAVAHVLVAEDAPVARELLCGILRSFGLRVTDVADGREALRVAREAAPDLIITDLEMPFLGGLELAAELRRDPELRSLPVLVLTTRDDPETRARAEALGVRGFLSKQKFVESDLRELIDANLVGR